MLTKGREHLQAARVLLESELFRGCVSQSYYAAFSAMYAYIGEPPSKRWAHIGLRKNFTRKLYEENFPPEECSRLNQNLMSLYTIRLDADYEKITIPSERAHFAIEFAEEILNLVERRLGNEFLSL